MNNDTLAQRLHVIAHGGDRCAYGGISCSVWRKISEELTMPSTDTGILDDAQINAALREQLAQVTQERDEYRQREESERKAGNWGR